MPVEDTYQLPADIRERAARVRLTVFDVDGTLTDGRLWYTSEGHELKAFHVHDGLGLKRLHEHGIEVAIISARMSHAVSVRAQELGIVHVYQGHRDKRVVLLELLEALQLTPQQTAFVGDDLPDLPAMEMVGLAIAVANAHPDVAARVHWQTRLRGGEGAVREVSDMLLAAQATQAGDADQAS